MTVEWQTPPPDKRGASGQIRAIVEELKAHPGEWALVRAGCLNSQSAGTFRKHGCETTTRTTADRKYDVYARWPADA